MKGMGGRVRIGKGEMAMRTEGRKPQVAMAFEKNYRSVVSDETEVFAWMLPSA